MLIAGIKPGHDGGVAIVSDRKLIAALESEKDSYARHAELTPATVLQALETLPSVPDIVAVGGWRKPLAVGEREIEAGYEGARATQERWSNFCGKPMRIFSSSHIRSHIMMAAGMAPPDDAPLRAVLVWEGYEGSFYLLDERWSIVLELPVLIGPGWRYAFLYAIADPRYADDVVLTYGDDSGKVMALAGYADPADATDDIVATVRRLMDPQIRAGVPKRTYKDSPLYNIGVEADATKAAAALLQTRMFDLFARAAQKSLPPGIPLYISGGCGLNCDWNTMWRELGHFSSVFVPPCPSDSGSAVGTAIDALYAATGDPRIDWDVYCGREFEWDREPDSNGWRRRPADDAELADALASGRVVAWVQGRWELGPRALGNRSLLANPFDAKTRDDLNHIKQREGYRPIAPCCRLEDAGKVFDADFHDPYMLYFRRVTSSELGAVTHVDGSARVQTVTARSNKRLHDLLSAFADRYGVGVLCNTSLNYKLTGFINRMSDLVHYCELRGITDMVVGETWLQRARQTVDWERVRPLAPHVVTRLLEQHVAEGATVAIASNGVDELLDLSDRRGWHFPQNEDGTFRGAHPANGYAAIAELERLREKGASHLAIPKSQLWWFAAYPELHEHLKANYRRVLPGRTGCVVFELAEVPSTPEPAYGENGARRERFSRSDGKAPAGRQAREAAASSGAP